ncbi:hypothetical protein NDU88_005075 [Pleurodeles waltl]|uniref:Aminoglycoside phosphotransferase n=1 Tax=Pleurodeles waltl TaxID=8319 RepID=A0AAV7PHJ0_PLEWA|nr:hypothetical protein NDU88_005075 [Pleurodeles waltl]
MRHWVASQYCQKGVYDGGRGMADAYLYYVATQLLVVHDWYNGGWADPAYQIELESLGFPRILDFLYGSPIPRDMEPVTQADFLA